MRSVAVLLVLGLMGLSSVVNAGAVIPKPAEMTLGQGVLRFDSPVSLDLGNESSLAKQVKAYLADLGIEVVAKPTDESVWFAIRTTLIASSKQDKALSDQGYQLKIGDAGILLNAPTAQGVFYGLATLKQLLARDSKGYYLPYCDIRDVPSLQMRGAFLNLRSVTASDASLKVLRDLIDAMASMKINALFLEVADNMKYERVSFPATKNRAFSKEQVKSLVSYARSRHVEVIPYLQTISHVIWIMSNPANVDLLEDPNNLSWHAGWCPSKPQTRKFVEDILAETIEVFQPKYIHLCMDEIVWGPFHECALCKKKASHEVLADAINHMHGILEKRGIRMILYHDEFINLGHEHAAEQKVQGWKALDLIPKDIIFNVWFYGEDREGLKKTLDHFNAKGFGVLGAVFNDPKGIKQMGDMMANRPDSLGSIITYWFYAGDWSIYNVAPWAMASTSIFADLAWNPSTSLDGIKYDPVWEFWSAWKDRKTNNENLQSFPVELSRKYNQGVFLKGGGWPIQVTGVEVPLARKTLSVNGHRFKLAGDNEPNAIVVSGQVSDGLEPEVVTIPVNRKAALLAFVHACDIPVNIQHLRHWSGTLSYPHLGDYTIVYSDGSRKKVPIRYRMNITDWNSRLAPNEGKVAFEARGKDGTRVMFGYWAWTNPTPGKTIKAIELTSKQYKGASIALLGVTALCEPTDVVPIDSVDYRDQNEFSKEWRIASTNVRTDLQIIKQSDLSDGRAVEVRANPFSDRNPNRITMDRDISVSPEQFEGKAISIRIFLDHPKGMHFGFYLGPKGKDGQWGTYRCQYLQLKPGWNNLSFIPVDLFAEGGDCGPDENSQMRLSFWTGKKPARLIIDDVKWVSPRIKDHLNRGKWYE